jgi:hypothetical protein
MAPSIALRPGNTANIHSFVPGDSILKSLTLVSAVQELVELLDITIFDYNQDNPTLLYPDISVNYDAGVCTATIPVPYRKVAGVKKSVDYLNAYSGWVTPTTGELTGVDNILDAYMYLLDSLGDANDALRPGLVIQSAKGTTTNNDDGVAKERQTSFNLPYDTVVNLTTGIIEKIFQDYVYFVDKQQGYAV